MKNKIHTAKWKTKVIPNFGATTKAKSNKENSKI